MKIAILIPHFRVGKITAYAVSQFLKFKGKHEVEIIVIDNSYGHPSIEYLSPFKDQITILNHETDKLSSHGVALDFAMFHVEHEYVIAAESDSFPLDENWLDYYEDLVNKKVDLAGSLLQLSGGTYLHPCLALIKKTLWREAHEYALKMPYTYFPNMAHKEGFDCHLMVHNDLLDKFLENPKEHIILANNYKGLTKEEMLAKADWYRPTVGAFHNGMWGKQESIYTYGQRDIYSESPFILLPYADELIWKIGAEPGQFLSYYALATNKSVYSIPTQVIWMKNRQYQQQERTVNEAGAVHIWGGTAMYNTVNPALADVTAAKRQIVDDLYNSLPDEQKITPTSEVIEKISS